MAMAFVSQCLHRQCRSGRGRLMAMAVLGPLRQRLRLMATAFDGSGRQCRTHTAFVLVPQACKVRLTLQAPQSLAGKPDVEAAAAKPQEDCSGGRPVSFLGAVFGRTSDRINAPGKEAFGKK
jgi:hypothetical protein